MFESLEINEMISLLSLSLLLLFAIIIVAIIFLCCYLYHIIISIIIIIVIFSCKMLEMSGIYSWITNNLISLTTCFIHLWYSCYWYEKLWPITYCFRRSRNVLRQYIPKLLRKYPADRDDVMPWKHFTGPLWGESITHTLSDNCIILCSHCERQSKLQLI